MMAWNLDVKVILNALIYGIGILAILKWIFSKLFPRNEAGQHIEDSNSDISGEINTGRNETHHHQVDKEPIHISDVREEHYRPPDKDEKVVSEPIYETETWLKSREDGIINNKSQSLGRHPIQPSNQLHDKRSSVALQESKDDDCVGFTSSKRDEYQQNLEESDQTQIASEEFENHLKLCHDSNEDNKEREDEKRGTSEKDHPQSDSHKVMAIGHFNSNSTEKEDRDCLTEGSNNRSTNLSLLKSHSTFEPDKKQIDEADKKSSSIPTGAEKPEANNENISATKAVVPKLHDTIMSKVCRTDKGKEGVDNERKPVSSTTKGEDSSKLSPSNMFHLVTLVYTQHETTVQRLIFNESELHRLCTSIEEGTVIKMDEKRKLILFEKLSGRFNVRGLFGNPMMMCKYMAKYKILSDEFVTRLEKNPNVLQFGIYGVLRNETMLWVFLWSPRNEAVDSSILITAKRMLFEICEDNRWFVDVSSPVITAFLSDGGVKLPISTPKISKRDWLLNEMTKIKTFSLKENCFPERKGNAPFVCGAGRFQLQYAQNVKTVKEHVNLENKLEHILEKLKMCNANVKWLAVTKSVKDQFNFSKILENQSGLGQLVREVEECLYKVVPELEDYHMKYNLYLQFRDNIHTGIKFCTWCGMKPKHNSDTCHICGIRTVGLMKDSIKQFKNLAAEIEKTTFEHMDRETKLPDISVDMEEAFGSVKLLRDKAVILSGYIRKSNGDRKDFREDMSKFDHYNTLDDFLKAAQKKYESKGIQGYWKSVLNFIQGGISPFEASGDSYPEKEATRSGRLPFYSVELFNQYNSLREALIVESVIARFVLCQTDNNNLHTNIGAKPTLQIEKVASEGDLIRISGDLSYGYDAYLEFSPFSFATHQITTAHRPFKFSCHTEEVQRCFIGMSGTMVVLLKGKLDDKVEIVLLNRTNTQTIKLRKVPELITYLDGTNQLLAIVAKDTPLLNKDQNQQHQVVVYSLFPVSNVKKEYYLPLRAELGRKSVAEIVKIKFIPYDQKLSLLDAENILHIWDWQTKKCEWQIDLECQVVDYNFSPDGECLIIFERNNSHKLAHTSIKLKLSKMESTRNYHRWSDIPDMCYIETPLNIKKDIGSIVSTEVYATSSNEIIICVSSEDYILPKKAQLELNVKKIKYVIKEASENKEDISESFSNNIRQLAELFTKFPTSLPGELHLSTKFHITCADQITKLQCEDIRRKVSHYISTKLMEEGKLTSSVPWLGVNTVVQSLGDATCEGKDNVCSNRKISSGEWIKQLILLLPIQILRTQAMRLCPIIDGYNLQTTIKTDTNTDQQAVTAATSEISFGPLTSVILSHEGKVKVIANVGRTSTGKSYLANHLLGTLFYVDAARCTDGIWMSAKEVKCNCERCDGGKALVISIDVEGLGSFSRSVQEDALLSQFTFSISSLVILNQREKVMDRDIRDMLLKFTSGMKVTKSGNVQNRLHGDETLFNATFALALKDIAMDERDSILRQVMAEIDTCQRQSLELQKLFQLDPYVVALPYQKSQEYYETLHQHLYDEILKTKCVFNNGFTFFMKCITIIGSLALSSSQPLSTEYLDSLKSFLKNNLDEAIKTGYMPLRNPRYTVPDYPDGNIQILPHISDIEILEVGNSNPSGESNTTVGMIHSTKIVANLTSVPGRSIGDLSIKVENERVELQMNEHSGRSINNIQIVRKVNTDEIDIDVKEIFGARDHFIVIKRSTEAELQNHLFQVMDNEIEIDITSLNAIAVLIKKLKTIFECRFPRDGINETSWLSSFRLLVSAIVERRKWRLNKWIELLAQESSIQSNLLLERKHTDKFEGLNEVAKLCGNQCGQENCHFKCLLPHKQSVVSQCDCLNVLHVCQHPCSWSCHDEFGVEMPCSLGAGHCAIAHDDMHKCSSGRHNCQALCSIGTCLKQCTKADEHVGEHHCQQNHFCPNTCSAPFCASPCMLMIDDMHQFCICNQSHCTFPCEMPGCNEQCYVLDHFHCASNNNVHHICSKRHQCFISCEHQGTCEVSQILDCPMRHFKAVVGKTEDIKVTIQKSLRHSCCATIPEVLSDNRLPYHTGKHRCDTNHQCPSRCPMCKYFCQEQVEENGLHLGNKHNTHHGTMLQMYFVCKDIDLQVDVCGSRVGSSDIAYNQLCEMYCLDLPEGGRGHFHIWQNPQKHIKDTTSVRTKFKPDDGKPKTAFKHCAFWQYIQFEDPYPEKNVEKFMMCNYSCKRCGNFCRETLWHHRLSPGKVPGGGHISGDGHYFPCEHDDIHYLLLFDRSASMKYNDICPKHVCHDDLRNRFGTALESTLVLLDRIEQCTSTASLIVFGSSPEILAEKTSISSMKDIVRQILSNGNVQPKGGTDFNKALNTARRLLKKHCLPQEHTVMIFLSDGECSIDLSIIDKLKRLTNDFITLYAIHCAANNVGESLSSMVQQMGGASLALHCNNQLEMRNQFIDVAKRALQQYHVLPLIEGFDPKLKVLEEKRKVSIKVDMLEPVQLISSYCSSELWDLVRKKMHPQRAFSDSNLNSTESCRILFLGTDNRICFDLVRASADFHNAHIYHIDLKSDEASAELLRLIRDLDNCTGTVIILFHHVEAMKPSIKELVQFILQRGFSCQISLVGISCNPYLLINSVLLLFTEIIHVELPDTRIRENVIKGRLCEVTVDFNDSLIKELVDATAGLNLEQINEIFEESMNDEEIRQILNKMQDLAKQGKSQHRVISKLSYVHDKFLKGEIQQSVEIKDDFATFLELLKRLVNADEAAQICEYINQYQNIPKTDLGVFALILSIPDNFRSLKMLQLIANYLDICLSKVHKAELQFGTPSGLENNEERIIWASDISTFVYLLRQQETGMKSLVVGCFNQTCLEQYSLEQEMPPNLNIHIVHCQSPSLDVRRMYISDYIHKAFNVNDLNLNREQNLYWLGYHSKGLCHLDLEELVQQAYFKSLDAVFESECCQELLFEKAEKPLYVACDNDAYGAKPLSISMLNGEYLRPPPLSIRHLGFALEKYFGHSVANGKVVSQAMLSVAVMKSEGDNLFTLTPVDQTVKCSVQFEESAVVENCLTLTKVTSKHFLPNLAKEIDKAETLISDTIHIGPTSLTLEFPMHICLPFEANGCTQVKLMNSPTAFGKPTSWNCVIMIDLASTKITACRQRETMYDENGKVIITNKLGLWSWIGVKHVQPVKIKILLYHMVCEDTDARFKLQIILQLPDEVKDCGDNFLDDEVMDRQCEMYYSSGDLRDTTQFEVSRDETLKVQVGNKSNNSWKHIKDISSEYTIHVADLLASDTKLQSFSMDFVRQKQQKKTTHSSQHNFCCDIVIHTETRKCHVFSFVKENCEQILSGQNSVVINQDEQEQKQSSTDENCKETQASILQLAAENGSEELPLTEISASKDSGDIESGKEDEFTMENDIDLVKQLYTYRDISALPTSDQHGEIDESFGPFMTENTQEDEPVKSFPGEWVED